MEKALASAYEYAARWSKVTLLDDFAVDIFSDFGISLKGAEDIKSLQVMVDKGRITHETFLREIKRRGLLSEAVDVDEEIGALAEAGPSL